MKGKQQLKQQLTNEKVVEFLSAIVIKIINFSKRYDLPIREVELTVGEWLVEDAKKEPET